MILIDALYINCGGGRILLEYLIDYLHSSKHSGQFYFLIDERIKSTGTIGRLPNTRVQILTASENNRTKFYRNNIQNFNTIFCFANIPPPIKTDGLCKTFVFFQNMHLVSNNFHHYKLKEWLLFFIKRRYIKLKNKPEYIWIVQSELVKKAVLRYITKNKQTIEVLPFFDIEANRNRHLVAQKRCYQYVYVASELPQKNHAYLLKVWETLFDEYQLKPRLIFTLGQDNPFLTNEIKRLRSKGIDIENKGICNKDEINTLYSQSEYLVFPSVVESFGLPLVEAVAAGCKVIATDRPYIHEAITPSALFNDQKISSLAKIILKIELGQINLPQTTININNEIEKLITLLSQRETVKID